MLITKIIPHRIITKRVLPLTIALMSVPAVASTQIKSEPSTDVLIKEKVIESKESRDEMERGFPWLDALILACMAGVGGAMALGNYADKKIDEKEANSKTKEASAEPENPQQ